MKIPLDFDGMNSFDTTRSRLIARLVKRSETRAGTGKTDNDLVGCGSLGINLKRISLASNKWRACSQVPFQRPSQRSMLVYCQTVVSRLALNSTALSNCISNLTNNGGTFPAVKKKRQRSLVSVQRPSGDNNSSRELSRLWKKSGGSAERKIRVTVSRLSHERKAKAPERERVTDSGTIVCRRLEYPIRIEIA